MTCQLRQTDRRTKKMRRITALLRVVIENVIKSEWLQDARKDSKPQGPLNKYCVLLLQTVGNVL